MKRILTIFLIYSLCSCSPRIEKTIEGMWSIDTIEFKGTDIKLCLRGNLINFEDELVWLSAIPEDCLPQNLNSHVEVGTWKIKLSTNKKDTLPIEMEINSRNIVYNGRHHLVFHKDETEKLLKMEIFSDNLYIICRKGFYSYEKHIETIEELEKMSWTTRPK